MKFGQLVWSQFCIVRVCKFRVNWLHVSWIRPMNWRRSYQKATSPFYKLHIWTFCMTRVDTKFEQSFYCSSIALILGRSKSAFVCTGWVWFSCQLSWIRPTHWRLNGDFDINQRRRRSTRKIPAQFSNATDHKVVPQQQNEYRLGDPRHASFLCAMFD